MAAQVVTPHIQRRGGRQYLISAACEYSRQPQTTFQPFDAGTRRIFDEYQPVTDGERMAGQWKEMRTTRLSCTDGGTALTSLREGRRVVAFLRRVTALAKAVNHQQTSE